jgi:2-polyprenyl-3-methyl-5-hydroxy-6-metoxy-1,4-benzoquinol methylase
MKEPLECIYRERWSPEELTRVRAVWRVLAREFFQKLIPAAATVLDVGCGFCHFLNEIRASERIGVDGNPACANFAEEGVTVKVVRDFSLSDLPERHFDFIFVSNVLEHLENGTQVIELVRRCGELLSDRGRLVILQPNFRLVGARYFDFIDHKTVLTDASIRETLILGKLNLVREIRRFLPYTTKSRFFALPLLVSLYLRLPLLWLLFGQQSLFVAERSRP